jgi:sugar lactone lactonase
MEEIAVTVFHDRHCHLGEGPTYDQASDTAWWFDILERTLFEADLAVGKVKAHALPAMASALAFIDHDRQLVAMDTGLYVRNVAHGSLKLHTPLEADNAATRSNDGRAHPSGALWIGTMGRNAEPGAGSIYHFHRGELRRLYSNITIPNAICFSVNGATAYFTDTRSGVLNRVAVDPANGLPLGEPAMLFDHRAGIGGLDGAVVDAEGLIWNARWGGACIDAYTPEGERIRSIRIPATQPSCPMFIGRRFDRLLVTSAWQNMDEVAKAADPHHGQTFVLDVAARGRPEARVRIS